MEPKGRRTDTEMWSQSHVRHQVEQKRNKSGPGSRKAGRDRNPTCPIGGLAAPITKNVMVGADTSRKMKAAHLTHPIGPNAAMRL